MKYIRIHIIPTANDDGSKAAQVTAWQVQECFKSVNELYKQADIAFLFDPQTDFDPIRRSTLLNQDMLEVPNADLNSPSDKCPGDSKPFDAEKDRIGKEYPGKLVIFVGCGDRYLYDRDKKKWEFRSNGNWCSGHSYVRMADSQFWGKYAHEIGHYLDIGWYHESIQGNVGSYLEPYTNISEEQVKTIQRTLEPAGIRYHLTSPRVLYDAVFASSKPGQTRVLGWGQTDFAIRFDKEVALNRHIKHMQAYDIGGNQIRWNGIWEPGNTVQTRAICWAFDDFAGRVNQELGKGKHFTHMQAYDVGNNQIRWDGVWENGNTNQSWVMGWAIQDFAKKFNDEIANGRHIVHMQAYNIGDGQIRWDGIWEPGNTGETRAICWAFHDFVGRFNQELAKGKHLVHMQAYDIGGNQIRWDGVWEDGSRGQTWVIGWAFNDFVSRFNDELAKNRHLVHMQAYDIGYGQIRYDGIWEDGLIKQTRVLGLDISDFTVRLDDQLAKGNHIVHMQAYMRK
jgi:hypothetical protein